MMMWNQSRDDCVTLGGHLVIVESEEEWVRYTIILHCINLGSYQKVRYIFLFRYF